METGVVIVQEPVSAMINEGANEYLVGKQADETVKNDDIEGPPGVVDCSIKAHEAKVVPDKSIGHSGSNGVTIGSADPAEVPNGSGNKENEGAEEERATHDNPVIETTDITKEKSIAAENFDVALDRQASDFVEASSVRNEETGVHDPGMVSVVGTESLNQYDHGDNGKAQPVETNSKINDSERILVDATVDSKREDEITRKIEELHESSKVIEEAVSTEKHTAQQQLHSIESSPVHEETMVESSEALMDTPPATANTEEEMVRSCKEIEIEENSNQAHEESQRSITDKDIEEHVPEENMPKDETTITQSEAVDTTTAEEEKISKNSETILDASETVHTTEAEEEEIARDTELLDEGENTKEGPLGSEMNLTKEEMLQKEDEETTEAAEQKIPRNAEAIVNETEASDTITEQEEKISKDAETILEVTEAVNTSASEEEKIAKELPDVGETTKDGHLGPQENLTKETKNDKLQKEGEDTTENETEAVQTTIAAEEEIRKNDDTILKESEAADTTTAEEEGISKNAETKLEANVNIHTMDAAEEKISKDAEILDEGETTRGHPEPQENLAAEILQKECRETTANETETLQIPAVAEEEIPKNVETIVNETTMVVPTAVEEQISGNADTILDATESVHATTAAEEKIAKNAELLDKDETTKEGHLGQEENLIEEDRKEMLHKEGEETIQIETQAVQTIAVVEEDILKNDNNIINEPEAADNSTAEEERICKIAEMTLDATEAVLTTDAAEENISKDIELLGEGETTNGCLPEQEENVTKEEMLQNEGGETTADETEAVQTAAASEEEIPKNVKTVVNETEAVDPVETEEERISDNVEPILDTIEAVQSRTAAEEKTAKDDELLDEGETTKDGHLGQEENLTEKEMLQKEGGEIIADETEVVQTPAASEEKIPKKAETIVNETEATKREETISKDAETIVEATEAVRTMKASEGKLLMDTELLDEGETTDRGHPEPEENQTKEEMLQKEGAEILADETEAVAVQTTAESEEEILSNVETIAYETESVEATTAEEERISSNAEPILNASEAVHTTTTAEEKIAKDAELLDESKTTKEVHLEQEENLTKEDRTEMLRKEGSETIASETEALQTTATAEEEIQKNAHTAVNETEAVVTGTAEEKISKNADPDVDGIDTGPTPVSAEEIILKDTELLDEDETAKEGNLKPDEIPTGDSMLHKEDEDIKELKAGEDEAIKTVILSEEVSQKIDDVEYIKDKTTAKETGAHEVDDEMKSSDQENVQTAESSEHMEPSSSGVKIDELLPEKSSTDPEEKMLQEEDPEAVQVTKKEGLELEESPSGILLKVGSEDHGSEDKEKLTEGQVAEESGECQIAEEQRGLTPGDLEAEKNDQNKTRYGASDETKDQETMKTDEMMKGPLENPVAVESVGLGETTHDQNLPEAESIKKMEKACPELPSDGLKQTTETVDGKIEEKPEEAGHLDQEGQEEGPPTKGATHSPLESREVEERALEERSVDDPSPLQEESCLPKEQIDETHSQEEQTEKHESSNEAIPEDQPVITEEKSDEHIRIPLALPSEEQKHGSLAEPERVEDEKVKDTESASDRIQEAIETTETPELNSVPSFPAEKSEADETPSSELISGLDEQTPKQVEEIIEEERKEEDELEAVKVPSSEDILQEISEKEPPSSAMVSKEEEQVTASDDVTIQEAKGEKEIAEMNESQEEVLHATETKETAFPEEEQHGDPEPSKNDERLNVQIRLQEQLQALPSDEKKIVTTDASEKLQKPKEDEERPQVLEPLSKDTGVADQGLPLEQSNKPNAETKVSDEQIQISSDVGDSETLEGSHLTKVTEVTVDESLLEEKSDEQVESTMKIKQEESPTEEKEEGDKEIKETERTEALEGSCTSETLEIRQEEPKDHEAPNLEDTEEDKNQKVPETTEEQEAQADHCLPIETSEPDQTPSTELVLGGDEQTPKQVDEINEAKTKEEDELQSEEIPPGEIIPVESSDDKGPTSVLLASGEAEQVTASDAVTMQESKSEDEGTKMKGKVEVPAAVETEDMILDTKTLEDEAKEKLERATAADQSHIEEKSDDQVEEPPQELSLEKQVLEPSTEATPVEDEDATKINTGIAETVEGQSMSNTSEDACLNQEEIKDHGPPKQCGITEDQTLPKGENPDDTSFLNKTGEVEHEDGLNSALPTAQTENVVQTTLDTESDTRDAPALGETMAMEPAEEAQQAGDDEVESKEKDFETSIKLEGSESEEKHPVAEITGLETGEKQDMKEEEGVTAAEKQESCVEEQSAPANELNLLNKPTEEVDVQEEQIRELEAGVEEKIQEEEIRKTVEREETIPACCSLSEEISGEKIQLPSSTLAFEEPEHAISTEKQEDKSEESSLPKNESHEDFTSDTFSDQNMPEETPDEKLQPQSTNTPTEKLVRETQAEIKKVHDGGRKEEEESVAQAQHDANAAAVEKASLQEEPPKDPKASEKVGDTIDQIIEAQEPAVFPETRSSASLSQETEQKPDSPEPAEGENVAIIEGKKNEEIQEEKPEDTSATMQKEEAFSPKVKTDIGDATERGTHHDLTSLEVEKEEPQSGLRHEEEINGAVPTEKQIIQSPEELREKADGIEFESNEETAELQARSDDTMSDEKHHALAADSGITGEQGGEGTKEISGAEAKNEEWSLQEQTKETNIYTAEKSTNNLVFSMEQAPKDQIEEIKMQEEKPRELEAQIEEILTDQPLVKDAQIEQEEPSAKEQRNEPSLSEEEEEKGPQDIKHEVECSLNSQTAEVVEEPQQMSSTLASEDNKHQNLESATEVEEKAKEDSENLKEKSTSEAFVVSLTESTIQSKEATPEDGPTVAPDDVMKIQAPEMIERDEILQEVAGKENNVTSEKSDQISLQEVTNQIHKENKLAGFATVVTGDIPKEENLSGQKEDISTEKNIEEPMPPPESLPAKADKVLAEKETAQENLNDTKDTDEETREIKPEIQKIESVSTKSLPQGENSKVEEQETEISRKEDCLSQPKEITEEFQKLEKSIPLVLNKEIPVEATLSQQKTVEDLQKNEGEADGAGNIKGTSSEIKGTEHVEGKIDNLDEKITESPTSKESGRNSLSDLLQKVKKGKETKTGEEGTRVEEATTDKIEDIEASHIEEAKIEENKDDEGDGDEHKEDKTSPDSVVMVEARDVNDKTPHKKSHGILSGVGSKVKHSISKVKKAITGKSSHTKPVSPK